MEKKDNMYYIKIQKYSKNIVSRCYASVLYTDAATNNLGCYAKMLRNNLTNQLYNSIITG